MFGGNQIVHDDDHDHDGDHVIVYVFYVVYGVYDVYDVDGVLNGDDDDVFLNDYENTTVMHCHCGYDQ